MRLISVHITLSANVTLFELLIVVCRAPSPIVLIKDVKMR